MSEETTMTTETSVAAASRGDKINTEDLRLWASSWARSGLRGASERRAREVLALVEAVEAAQETLAAIDRALAASKRDPDTYERLRFCVGATLDLREHLDRFDVPGV